MSKQAKSFFFNNRQRKDDSDFIVAEIYNAQVKNTMYKNSLYFISWMHNNIVSG